MKKEDMLIGAGGGDSQESVRTPDNLLSQDFFELVLAVSEGPIKGLVRDGDVNPLVNFYAGGTPAVSRSTGEANFSDFVVTQYDGASDDPPIVLTLGGTSVNTPVNVPLSSGVSVIRQTSGVQRNLFDRIEFRIRVEQLVKNNSEGMFEATAQFKIEYKRASSTTWLLYNDLNPVTLTGKTTSGYVRDFVLEVPRVNEDYDLRVTKLSADGTSSDGITIALSWESFQLVKKGDVHHPGLSLVHVHGKASSQFSSVPDFFGDYDGLIVRVPVNYNPVTRVYDETTPWNGTFKNAYTNNAVWILYELITNETWGMARYYRSVTASRYEFYEEAKWIDEMVSDGRGGQQPRFTYNDLITESRNGMELLQYVAGSFGAILLDDGNGVLSLVSDRPRVATQVFTPESVGVDGFSYSFTDTDSRYNEVVAVFINPDLEWQEDRRAATIDNTAAIAQNGRVPHEFIAVGCTDANEAVRRANLRYITANFEVTTVDFVTSRFGLLAKPHDTIMVCDPLSSWGYSGRVKTVVGSTIHLRDPLYFTTTAPRTMKVQTYDGLVSITVTPPSAGEVLTLAVTTGTFPTNVPDRTVFTIEDTSGIGLPKPFRVLSVGEIEGKPDQIQIAALEIAENKHTAAVTGTVYTPSQYSYKRPGEAVLPSSLTLVVPAPIITADGSLTYQIEASWKRPIGANTKYFELDFKAAEEASWKTERAYGDRAFLGPVRDGVEYTVRLYAVSPLGSRSQRFVEGTITPAAPDITIANVSGLAVQRTTTGWAVSWAEDASIKDYEVTDVRIGTTSTAASAFSSLPVLVLSSTIPAAVSWYAAGAHRLFAKHKNRRGNVSAVAQSVDWTIQAPAMPILTIQRTLEGAVVLFQDCTTSQPLREVQIRTGGTSSTWDTATPRGSAGANQRSVTILPSATSDTKVYLRAVDVADNASATAVAVIPAAAGNVGTLLDWIEDGIPRNSLSSELFNVVALIDTPVTGLVDKVDDLEATYGSTVSAATSAAAAAQSAADAAQAEADAILAAAGATTASASAVSAAAAAAQSEADAILAETGAETANASAIQAAADAVAAKVAALAAEDGAEVARNTAQGAATTATTKAAEASTSATSASTAATAAAGSAAGASTSATTAANSATSANNSAGAAATSATSANTAATNAATSASASQSSRVAAESARDAAQGSATSAATSASTATTKATEAGTSAAAANTSATQAATSASSASTSATQAATSATNASGSASSAATSATAAAGSATNAGNSATAAATSASSAATSATNSGNSATASQSSRVAAESARDAAQNVVLKYRIDAKGSSATIAGAQQGVRNGKTNALLHSPGRSWNVLVLDRATGAVVSHTTYDVYGAAVTASPAMISALDALTDTKVVAIYSYDEPRGDTWNNAALKTAIKRCGGTEALLSAIKFRSAYLLVGIPGVGEGGGVERYVGSVDSDVNAWTYYTIQVVAGEPINVFANVAEQKASAAATSASTAVTAATNAGTSASAASTSATQAATSAGSASTSATQAATSATNATGSANSAATSATAAANSATSATNSASAASTSASTANTAATNAGNSATAANTAKVSAESARDAAQGSATAASTSASTAATSATNAGTSATAANSAKVAAESARDAASGSATAAAGSASTATTKATEAGTSATAAATSATNAATSAGAASTSATNAATSATNASGSANSASTSATAAANSATTAGNSATAAAGSATNAATSATNAGTSATAAQASRVAAESSFGSSVRLNGNYDFGQGKTGWSTAAPSSAYAEVGGTISAGGVTANSKLVLTGYQEVYWNRRIPVQTSRVYRIRFRVRSIGTTGAVIYAGAATFDASGALETTSPGTHRYCTASAISVPSDGSWKTYEGTITGAGNSTGSQFRPGTVFACPMFIVNYQQSASFICEIDECSFEDITESASAAGSASAAATSASQAATSATAAGTSATSAQTSATNASTSAGTALTYRDQASTSATTATTKANEASTSASAAATSAANASSSASAASTSANTANTKATEASTSATSAATSATSASTQASNAATSASQSSTSATNAAGSATNAATSATSAATSLQAIQATATGFDTGISWNFDANAQGWTVTGATSAHSTVLGTVSVLSSGLDPTFASPVISLAGGSNYLVRARIKRLAGSTWEGIVFYATAGHPFSSSFYKGVPDTTVTGQWRVIEWDMSALNVGGTDWMSNTITQIRLDLGALSSDQFEIDWVAIGRVAPQPYSAQIATEASVRATTDGYLGAQWALKVALINSNATAEVSGIAIAGTSAGTAGSRFDMSFRANAFYFLPPTGQGNTAVSPMVYYSTPTVVNGVTVPAGLYTRGAFIEYLSADRIDTRSLTIKDANGVVIFSANTQMGNDTAASLGFNPTFNAWTGSFPDGWAAWTGHVPVKNTAYAIGSPFCVEWTITAADQGMMKLVTFPAPLPAGTFVTGSFNMNILANAGGGAPGYLIRLYTNAALTTFVDTWVPMTDKTVTGWQRMSFVAGANGLAIHGIHFYQMAAWAGYASLAIGSVILFGPLSFTVNNPITSTNVSTYISAAAIGWAQIGNLVIDTTGAIRSGQTAYDTGTGWWMGIDAGVPKSSIGSPDSNQVWDGSNMYQRRNSLVVAPSLAHRVAARRADNTATATVTFKRNGEIARSLNGGTAVVIGHWYFPVSAAAGDGFTLEVNDQAGGNVAANVLSSDTSVSVVRTTGAGYGTSKVVYDYIIYPSTSDGAGYCSFGKLVLSAQVVAV